MTQTNEEAVCTKAAYVLFYQRRYVMTMLKLTIIITMTMIMVMLTIW